MEPELQEVTLDGLRLLTDPGAAAAGVLVAFTDRNGGVSPAPYDTLNLAGRGGDDPGLVEVNRKRAAEAIGFPSDSLALARQVHGAEVIEAEPGDGGILGECDVLVARAPGVTIGILTADCAPVIVWGPEGIAIAHAGWRGLVAGAIEEAVRRVGGVAAWVGPSIRACCYEVGPEVAAAFEEAGLPVAAPDRVDTMDAAVAALQKTGVEAIATTGICTHTDTRYFSYRRDGVTGRQGAFAALLPA